MSLSRFSHSHHDRTHVGRLAKYREQFTRPCWYGQRFVAHVQPSTNAEASRRRNLVCLSPQPDTPPLSTIVSSSQSQPGDHGLWAPTSDWVQSWKGKLPLQTIMRLLQELVPQVEKICMDRGLTDESEIIKFLQHGTLVGLLPVPHPILIRKYQPNSGTVMWFRTYMWGVVYLR